MSKGKILNPGTGKPYSVSEETEYLIQIVAQLNQTVNALSVQQLNLGFLIEYLVEKINGFTDEDGNPVIDLGIDDFPEFASARFEELQKQHQKFQQDLTKEQAKTLAEQVGVNLGD